MAEIAKKTFWSRPRPTRFWTSPNIEWKSGLAEHRYHLLKLSARRWRRGMQYNRIHRSMNFEEQQLVDLATSGDQRALQVLLAQNCDRLNGYLHTKLSKQLRTLVDVDDVLQEVLVHAYRDITKFEARGDNSFWPWLRTIADHRIKDLAKAQGRLKRGGGFARVDACANRSTGSLKQFTEMLSGRQRTPSSKAASTEAINRIRVILSSLPEANRAAITLRYVHGLSYEEIGIELNRTTSAVQGLIKRGKQKMREQMGTASAFLSSK